MISFNIAGLFVDECVESFELKVSLIEHIARIQYVL